MNLIVSILQKGILHVTCNTETFMPSVGENSCLVVYTRVSRDLWRGSMLAALQL